MNAAGVEGFSVATKETFILRTDSGGIVVFANEALAAALGYTPDELLKLGLDAVFPRATQPVGFDSLNAAIAAKRPWQGALCARREDGGNLRLDAFVTEDGHGGKGGGQLWVCDAAVPSDETGPAEPRQNGGLSALYRRFSALSIRTLLVAVVTLMAMMIAGSGILGMGTARLGSDSLQQAYAEHMLPMETLLKIVALMNDNRTQVMLALQHRPDSPFLHMHDHPVNRHTDQIVRNRDEITRLWADFRKREAFQAFTGQAERFFTARSEYVAQGLEPAIEALLGGDYDLANVTLLFKVNPLYQKADKEMNVLLAHFRESAAAQVAAAERRHQIILSLGVAGTLVAVALALVSGVFLNRAIVLPLRRAVGHFGMIAQGRLNQRIDISGHHETGQVLVSLAQMQAHLRVMLEDIRIREQAEGAMRQSRDQALETSRLKSEFLSTMSHEIRTPMNGIIGMADLLLDTRLTDEQRDFSVIIRDSAQSLLTIINDILDFSKIEAGKMEIEITDYSPVHLVEGSAELLAAKAREKRLSLMTFIDPRLPRLLRGDPTRLRQILINLAGNAVKFTEHGEVFIRALPEDNGKAIRFEVEDSGIGMSPRTLDKLFQSFTQADSSTTRKYGGTGLGLAICKRLVELMGGQIHVTSEPGKGSKFWFVLPAEPGSDLPHAQDKPGHGNVRGLRVLVVDDHLADRRILQHYLDSWGMRADSAAGADEALRLMRAARDDGNPFDIAMIDYSMPITDGLELAHAIRADAGFDATRLILLTAFDQRHLAEQALAGGFSAYLTKPVRQSQLFDSIAPKVADALIPGESTTVSPAPGFQEALSARRLVLLAEDNPVNQKVAQLHLNKLGYAVHIAGNGKEAVEAAATLPYAAILMDCQMPVMDGFEAAATIRKAERESGQHVPIIAMTANAMQGDRERCLAAGMDDYVSKPFEPAKLSRTLSAWIAVAPSSGGEESATPPPAASLDMARLREMFGDDDDLIAELIGVFFDTTASLVGKLNGAVAATDAAAVSALAHEAKGASSNMGAAVLAGIALRLEDAARDADWQRIAAQQRAFVVAFEEMKKNRDV